MTPDSDLAIIRRAGRVAALQASLALALVLLVVGAAVVFVDVQVQNQQITAQLNSAATTADDAVDPPPGTILILRDRNGHVQTSDQRVPAAELLARPTVLFDLDVGGSPYRGVVVDKADGRVVALLDLGPYHAGRSRLLLSLAVAELAGIAASVGVVILLTRRSIRPLVKALALQRRFVADASHELRAPLTVLHTRVQMLARRFDDGDAHAAKDQIDALAADTRALGAVIEDLLASATMTVDGTLREHVDLAEAAEAVCASMFEHAESGGVRLLLEREPGTTRHGFVVLGSESALRRAIASLVDNALAHQHPGGTVVIRVRRAGKDILVEVRDDGVGIDPDAMGTLFERFSHGHSHTGTGPRRYGIGLSLVREIAIAHHGDISAAHTRGGGATFTLSVPAAS